MPRPDSRRRRAGRSGAGAHQQRLRRAIEAAVAPDAALERSAEALEAALAVYKSRDEKALPALEAAIAKETNRNIKRALLEARAAIVLLSRTRPSRQARCGRRDPRPRRPGGDEPAVLAAGRCAAAVARAAAGRCMRSRAASKSGRRAERLVRPLAGSVLLLAAIGLASPSRDGHINMAHGEMVMIGAYTTFVVQDLIRTHNPRCSTIPTDRGAAGLHRGSAIGIAIERSIIRFLYGRPLRRCLHLGPVADLQQAVRTIFVRPTVRSAHRPG